MVISSFLSAILENQSLLVWVEKRGTRFVSHWKNDVEQLICIKLALAVLLGPMRPSGLCWATAGCASRWPESWGVFCTPKLLIPAWQKYVRKAVTFSSHVTYFFLFPFFTPNLVWSISRRGCWLCVLEQPSGSWDRATKGLHQHDHLLSLNCTLSLSSYLPTVPPGIV